MTTAERIKATRKKAGLTQKALGEALGVTQATIQQLESGKRNPKFNTLQRIADALNVPIEELINKKPRAVTFSAESNANVDIEMANLRRALAEQLGREPTDEEYKKYSEFSEIFIKGLRSSGDD